MRAKLAIWVFLIGAAVPGLPGTATAYGQYFSGFGATPWGYTSGYTYGQIRNTIPYFALHPPVYYSHSVSRPYGYSPFAASPESAGIGPGYPVLPQRVAKEPKPQRPRPKPLRIINPYVTQLRESGAAPQPTMPWQPQILSPAATPGATP